LIVRASKQSSDAPCKMTYCETDRDLVSARTP
jgi:hypothetical protein